MPDWKLRRSKLFIILVIVSCKFKSTRHTSVQALFAFPSFFGVGAMPTCISWRRRPCGFGNASRCASRETATATPSPDLHRPRQGSLECQVSADRRDTLHSEQASPQKNTRGFNKSRIVQQRSAPVAACSTTNPVGAAFLREGASKFASIGCKNVRCQWL